MKRITSRSITEAIKRGITFDTLALDCECTGPEAEHIIMHIYKDDPEKGIQKIKALKANAKKHKSKASQPPQPPQPSTEETKEKASSEQPKEAITEGSTAEEPKSPSKAERLADLIRRENELQGKIFELEAHHGEIRASRKREFDNLRNLDSRLDALSKEILQVKDEIIAARDQIAVLGEELTSVSSTVKPMRQQLDKLHQEIEELQVVTILVSRDGTIETPEDPDFIQDETGSNALRAEITFLPECEQLRVIDVKTLSRLLRIVKNSERKFRLFCDSEDLELAFWILLERI